VPNFLAFSPPMLTWSLIVLKHNLLVESARKNGYEVVYEKKQHF